MDAPDVFHIESMGPIERAYAEAMHEDCIDGPEHPLSDHSPWSGSDLDGFESWSEFTAKLARHGLTITLAAPAVTETADLRAALVGALRIVRTAGERVALAGGHVHLTDEEVADLWRQYTDRPVPTRGGKSDAQLDAEAAA